MPQSKQHKTMLAGAFLAGGILIVVDLLVSSGLDKEQVVALGFIGVILFFLAFTIKGIKAPYTIGKVVKFVGLLLACIMLMLPFSWFAWSKIRPHIHIIGFRRVQGYEPYAPNMPVQIEMAVTNDGTVDAKMMAYWRAQFLPHPKTDVGTSLEDQFFERAIKDARPAGILPGDVMEVSRGQGIQSIIHSMPLRPEEIAALQDRRVVSLYFAGRILYDDASDSTSEFVGERHTDFCIYIGPQPGHVNLCRDHREEP